MAVIVNKRLSVLIIWACCVFTAHAFIDGLYCGVDNCYDILGVTRDSERNEIVKSYRKLAKKWHPDMHRKQEDKKDAEEMFRKIANAYEILRDEEQRNDYDYMLDNPDEYYSHYYRYYRTRVAPKIDVRIVIAVAITIISLVQYLGAWSNYSSAISYLCRDQKYRMRAMDIAKADGKINKDKKRRGKTKEEIKEEEEAIIREIIEDKMDIRGGYSKPKWTDVLWIQMFTLPYYLVMYVVWWCRWVWKFYIKKEEYGEEEKLHLIRKSLKMSQTQFDAVEEHEKEDYLHQQLWIKSHFVEWKKQKDDEMKSKMADNGRYKMYRRYMKKGGAGQITFGPD